VVEAKNLGKGYGDRLLIDNLSFSLPPGGIVASSAPTAPARHPLPHDHRPEQPDSGTLRVGDTVVMSYVDQSRDTLDGTKTIWRNLRGQGPDPAGKRECRAVPTWPASTSRDRPAEAVKDLSGGERNRVHLAKLLKSGGN